MSLMTELYTETLETFLKNKRFGTASQDVALTEVLNLMAKFPKFVFGDLELSFTKLFIEKYDIREIGAETEELFLHFWRETTNRLLIKYVPKIQMWLDNFTELFKFKVNLTTEENVGYSNGTQDTYYLNPVTANTGIQKTVVVDEENKTTTTTYSGGNLKTAEVAGSDSNGQRTRILNRDVLQSVWGKTRPIILKQIMELEDIYNTAIKEYETIFMGIY